MAYGFDDDFWESLDAAYDEAEILGYADRHCEVFQNVETEVIRREGDNRTVREVLDKPDTTPDYYDAISGIVLVPEVRAVYKPEVQEAFLMQSLQV